MGTRKNGQLRKIVLTGSAAPNAEEIKKQIREFALTDDTLELTDDLLHTLSVAMSNPEVNHWSPLARGNTIYSFKQALLKLLTKRDNDLMNAIEQAT